MHALTRFLQTLIPSPYALLCLVSTLPLMEAKSGVTLAFTLNLPLYVSVSLCFFASSLLIPVILFSFGKVSTLLQKGKLGKKAERVEREIEERAKKVFKQGENCLSLYVFVALPLPLTGLWSGALVAAVARLSKAKAALALLLGNATQCLITFLVVFLGKEYAEDLFWILNFTSLSVLICTLLIKRRKAKKAGESPA